MARKTMRDGNKVKFRRIKFEHRLVMANWMLDLFGVADV